VSTATPETVRQHAAKGALHPVYLIVGDDERTVTAVVDGIASVVEDELRAFNLERLYTTDKDVTPDAIIEAARLVPFGGLLSPRRVVIVLRAEKWLKPRRAPAQEAEDEGDELEGSGGAAEKKKEETKGAMAPIVDYLKAPVPSTTLVFVASEVNKSVAAVKALYKTAVVVECWGFGDREGRPDPNAVVRQGVTWIKQAAAASGRQVEPAAAALLAQRSGGDIGKLRGDLDHVLLFAQGRKAVTRADVEAVVSDRDSPQDPWAVVNAIRDGRTAEALRHLGAALDSGAVPHMVLGQLAWFVRERLHEIRPQLVSSAVQAVFRTDLDLKTSGGDPRVLLERLVMELCGKPRR
jgi:DNA polymerase III delta subunit